jgi:RsiW-degrading membrane proteinase PrsW (M82 family)
MPVLGIVLGLLPGFAWLSFYLQEEVQSEPKRLLALTFVNGAIFAFLALAMQLGLKAIFDTIGVAQFSPVWLYAFAAVEELVKFWAAYAAIHNSPSFNEPVDAMLYIIVAALGFATVENIGVLIGGGQQSVILPATFHLITFRFLGATLLHTLASGVFGYYWARSIREFRSFSLLFFGFIFATVLHGTFNFLVLSFGEKGLSIVFLAILAFFVLADFEKLKTEVL